MNVIAGGSLVGVIAAFLNFKEDWVQQLNFAQAFDKMFGPGMSSARWTTMTAFGLMLVLLLLVGTAGRFKRKPVPAALAAKK